MRNPTQPETKSRNWTTVADTLGLSGNKPNVSCVMNVDRDAFADYMVESIKFYGEAER